MMAHYPMTVYAIFPFNDDGKNIAGVYVGVTHDLKERLDRHGHDHQSIHTAELHDLMRRNGFVCYELDTISTLHENHIEYDWINFFKERTALKVFNYRQDLCGADWHRLKVPA